MGKVVRLDGGVTVDEVMEDLVAQWKLGEIKEIYVVTIKKPGEHWAWASGCVENMAYAASVLTRRVHKAIDEWCT